MGLRLVHPSCAVCYTQVDHQHSLLLGNLEADIIIFAISDFDHLTITYNIAPRCQPLVSPFCSIATWSASQPTSISASPSLEGQTVPPKSHLVSHIVHDIYSASSRSFCFCLFNSHLFSSVFFLQISQLPPSTPLAQQTLRGNTDTTWHLSVRLHPSLFQTLPTTPPIIRSTSPALHWMKSSSFLHHKMAIPSMCLQVR